jgi:hypothetical protein
MNTTHRTARRVSWVAFALGVAASTAANIAAVKPQLGPQLASGFAPVALMLLVEIMSRVPWPAGLWWKLGRFAGAGTVALVAAVTSYHHMYGLLIGYGEAPAIALIQPACVDGLMVVASLALVALGTSQPTGGAPAADDTAGGDAASTNTSWSSSTQRDGHPAGMVSSASPVLPIAADAFARPNGKTTGGAR